MMLSNNELLNEKLIYLVLGTFCNVQTILSALGNSLKESQYIYYFLLYPSHFVSSMMQSSLHAV